MLTSQYQDEKTDADKSSDPSGSTSSPKKPAKPSEPTSFMVKNMTRVIPSQLSHLSFPDESRYQPIRPIGDSAESSKSSTSTPPVGSISSLNPSRSATPKPSSIIASEKVDAKISSGSIVILRDTKRGEEGAYVELDTTLWPVPEVEVAAPVAAPIGILPDGEADTPPPFEFNFED